MITGTGGTMITGTGGTMITGTGGTIITGTGGTIITGTGGTMITGTRGTMITGTDRLSIFGVVLIGAMRLCVLNLRLYQPRNIKFAFHFDVCTADFAILLVLVQNACKLNFMVHRIRRSVICENI